MTSVSGVGAGKAFVMIEAIDKTGKGLNKAAMRLKSFGQQITRIGQSMMLIGAAGSLPIAMAVKDAATLEEEGGKGRFHCRQSQRKRKRGIRTCSQHAMKLNI